MLNQAHPDPSTARAPATDAIDVLQRKLAARDKTIHVLKRRVKERDDSLATPMTTLEQNIALGKVVAMKTQQLSEERRELQEALAERAELGGQARGGVELLLQVVAHQLAHHLHCTTCIESVRLRAKLTVCSQCRGMYVPREVAKACGDTSETMLRAGTR